LDLVNYGSEGRALAIGDCRGPAYGAARCKSSRCAKTVTQ